MRFALSLSAIALALSACVGHVNPTVDAEADTPSNDVIAVDAGDAPRADSAIADGSDGAVSAACTAQAIESCACDNGATGTRECLPDGSHFGVCECVTYGRAIYVSPTGDDAASGDAGAPKATLEGALAVVRAMVSANALPAGGVVIWMAPGMYSVRSTVTLDASVSGTMDRPVVVRAQPGAPARLVGGTVIPSSAWTTVASTDPNYARIDSAARASIRVADLDAAGITDFGNLRVRGFSTPNQHAPLELFADGQPLRLGRWPDIDETGPDLPSPTATGITLYGNVTPDVTGHYTTMGSNDGVSVFVRDGLVGGLQYRLFRYAWTYQGRDLRAWFLTTDAIGYPSMAHPWWYLYLDGFGPPMLPSGGATGSIVWLDPIVANHGFASNAHAVSDTVFGYFGARPERWSAAPDAWVHGFFKYGWADEHVPITAIDTAQHTVTLGHTPVYGIAEGTPFYAYNLLEEVTQPGEWYLDRVRHRLYLDPPRDLAASEIVASMIDAPLVRASNAHDIDLRGLVLEDSRATLLEIENSSNVRAIGVTFRNSGSHGVVVNGHDNVVSEALVTGEGGSGVRLRGGDRPSLTPGNNSVTRSDLHHYGRWDYSYSAGVDVDDVGQRVTNNVIHDAPHNAVLFGGNEHRIERNDIHDVLQFTGDAGAIYGGRDWGARGNVIRNNSIHALHTHFGGLPIAAVYLDDCLSGIRVEGNIFRDVDGIAILHGGGRDDVMLGNVFARSGHGLQSDARCTTWARPTSTPGDSHNLLEKLERVHYQSAPWSIRYPECAAIPDDYAVILAPSATWLFPEGSRFASNVGYEVATWMADSEDAFMHFARMDNLETTASPFVSEAMGDLTPTAAVLAVPGFATIPVDQIGIRP